MLILVLVPLLTGCSLPLPTSSPVQTSHSYVLQWSGSDTRPAGKPRRDTLLVSPMHAASGFDGADMAYMRTPHEIEYFANHRWVDAPARMLEPLLVRAAEQTGLFRNVVESGSGTDVDLRLDSKLLHLQQVCRLNPSELQLALRVTLVDVASAKAIASHTLSVSEAIGDRTPYSGVQAANRAVARLLADLQEFLAKRVR